MTNPLFRWSLQDVVKLVQTCERFYQAYRDGPGGASTHITNFKEQVDNCHHVLELIREELFDQDRTLPSRKQKYEALEATLEKCSKIFETSEFLKAKGDKKVLNKLFATANYLFKVKENIQQLSGILQGHIAYIQVFQQLLQRKDTKFQIKQLESHGKLLEDQGRRQTEFHQSHDQKLDAISEEINNIKLLIDRGSEARMLNANSRAHSVIEIPTGSSSTNGPAVVAPTIYEQGQKSLNEVQELLDQLSSDLESSKTTDEERAALESVQDELESEEIRILNSIERNQIKGVQNAMHRHHARKQRVSRQDSGYYSSIGSVEYQPQSSQISRRPTESSVETSGEVIFSSSYAQPANDGPVFQQNSSLRTTSEVCQAKVIFNNGRHKTAQPCTVRANYNWERLHEVFPEYDRKLSDKIEVPRLLFPQNLPRPIPHVEPRGASSDDNAHLVQLKGHVRVFPAMKSLEYIFTSPEDSNMFQTLVFGKELETKMPINVRRIYSGRAGKQTKESDPVALRIWRRPSGNPTTRNDCSILFAVKKEGRPVKEHFEVFLHQIKALRDKPGEWLRVDLEPEVRTSAGERLNWLEFQLDRKTKEENKEDRATLAKYLNPFGLPTQRIKEEDKAGMLASRYYVEAELSSVIDRGTSAKYLSPSELPTTQNLIDELYSLLRDDEYLEKIYPQALSLMTVRKFQKSFEELLITYCRSLQETANHDDDRDRKIAQTAIEAVGFIRKHLRQLITRILSDFGPSDGREQAFAALQAQPNTQSRERVENSIQVRQGFNIHTPEGCAQDGNSDGSGDNASDDGLEDPRFVVTSDLKLYLVSNDAWMRLRLGLERLIANHSPPNISNISIHSDETTVEVSVPVSTTELEDTKIDGLQDQAIIPQISPVQRAHERLPLLGKNKPNERVVYLEWACQCGHSDVDFYEELAPGAVQELANTLRRKPGIVRAHATQTPQNKTAWFFQRCRNASLTSIREFRKWMGRPTLPTVQNTTATASEVLSGVSSASDPLFLLFCADEKAHRSVPTYEHIDLRSVKSDQELFNVLKTRYEARCKGVGISSSAMQDIHFVEFEIRPKSFVDCLALGGIPPISKKAIEYDWEITTTRPPIGSKYLLHLLDCPEDAADNDICIQRFPKKLKDKLEFARGRENKGWGIYFQERRTLSGLGVCLGMIGIILSLAFGIYWNVTRGDIQGAWGVASWIVAVVALTLFLLQNWGATVGIP